MQQHPLAITGMHRSGTSMIARGLHDSGLHLLGPGADKFIDTAHDNPEGFWENAAIVACNDDLLEATGGAWDNPPDLPPQGSDDPRVAHVVEAANTALAGLRASGHWGFKDPRICLTAAFWMDLEPELRFVICLRHPLEVALSLKRRNQNSYSLGLSLWEQYYSTVMRLLPADRRIVTHYESFFTDPIGEFGRLCAFAGLDPVEPHVRADLRHHMIDVSLAEADVSPTLRALYRDLSREAGRPLSLETPADEGQVRRLILDGTVAKRHAEQRQEAIDRLEERLQEGERRLNERETSMRSHVRELEVQLRTATKGLTELDHLAKRMSELQQLAQGIPELDRRTHRTAAKVDVIAQAVTLAKPRRAVRRFKGRVRKGASRYGVQPGRKVARRGKRAAVPPARAIARRLPAPTQQVLRRGRTRVARSRRPEPAERARPASSRPATGGPVVPSPLPEELSAKSFKQLVAATVPSGQQWLVIMQGSPDWVQTSHARRGHPFPDASNPQLAGGRSGRTAGADQALIAELEAVRYQGYERLVVPATSRAWFRDHVELHEHVTGRYPVAADQDGGVVFDLSARVAGGTRSLLAEIGELSATLTEAPAVLDWTDLDISDELVGMTTFRPAEGHQLPYLDSSVEIVVVDGSRDHREAMRVASGWVITVATTGHGIVGVASVETKTDRPVPPAPRTLLWSTDPNDDATWRQLLTEAATGAGASLHLGDISRDAGSIMEDCDVVVLVEPYVLPLPTSIEAAAALAVATPAAAVAGKVLRKDGALEAAGGTVFFDRSLGLIGQASADVVGPWHEYSRPVCWAPGLFAASTALWGAVPRPEHLSGRAFVREWCSEMWARGHRVNYEPAVAAVRVAGDGGEASVPLLESSWQRVLDLRPRRPPELSDGAWRYLLAHDDVEACAG